MTDPESDRDSDPDIVVAVAEGDAPIVHDAPATEPKRVTAQASETVVLVPVVDLPAPEAVDDNVIESDPVTGVPADAPPVVGADSDPEPVEETRTVEGPEPIEEPDPAEVPEPVDEPEPAVADDAPPIEAATPVRGHELLGMVVDTTGAAVPFVQVVMTDLDGGRPTALLTVDAEGTFAAEDVEPGRYSLAIAPRTLPKGLARTAAVGVCRQGDEPAGFGSVCVELLSTPHRTTTELVLPFSSVVAGNVVDENGQPVGGAIVRALAQVDRFREVNEIVRSDGLGRFALTLVPGPYELQVLDPGHSGAPDRVRSRLVQADEGTIYVLDAIEVAPLTSASAEASVSESDASIASELPVESATLEGRVVTIYGEPVACVEVACVAKNGVEIDRAVSDVTGVYEFTEIPLGSFDIVAGTPAETIASDAPGLLSEADPVHVEVRPTTPIVAVDDVVVDVERVFDVAGRVAIDPAALRMFKEQLLARDPAMISLPEYRFRRAYLRGLRLTVRMIAARRGEARPVSIAGDGTFRWSCTLPAEDFVFVLEPRSERLGAAFPGVLERPVSPSGVRTVEIVFECAPTGVTQVAARR